jgi:hypothetical protein
MSTLIQGQVNIRQAIQGLHPVSREACQALIGRMPDVRNFHMNQQFMVEEMVKCMIQAGIDHGHDKAWVEGLIKMDGLTVIHVAASVHELKFQQASGGWGKTAAAVGIGILIGALFG